ncbi:unnamed protein product, partial [marine sediment metagenome]
HEPIVPFFGIERIFIFRNREECSELIYKESYEKVDFKMVKAHLTGFFYK